MNKKSEATIRRGRPADSCAIATILRHMTEEFGWFPDLRNLSDGEVDARASRHLDLCLADDSHTVLVAENPVGTVVGYISVHWLPYMMLPGAEGYVSELFVLESERGRGIGRALLGAVREEALKRGCFRLQLVTASSRDSYKIYLKWGWTERPHLADFVLQL